MPISNRRSFIQTAGFVCALPVWLALLRTGVRGAEKAAGSIPVVDPADPIAKKIRFRPGHYLDLPLRNSRQDRLEFMLDVAGHPGVRGIESRFTWRSLEKSRDNYDFSGADRVFEHAARLKKFSCCLVL